MFPFLFYFWQKSQTSLVKTLGLDVTLDDVLQVASEGVKTPAQTHEKPTTQSTFQEEKDKSKPKCQSYQQIVQPRSEPDGGGKAKFTERIVRFFIQRGR